MTSVVSSDAQGGVRAQWSYTLRLASSRASSAPLVLFWLLVIGMLVLPIGLFLAVAISPALLGQGTQWFTLSAFGTAFSGQFLHGVLNSLMVGLISGAGATVLGGFVAWAVLRTNVRGRSLWSGSMFALLLAPSYLIALGWERLLEPSGVLDLTGMPLDGVRSVFYGAFGVTLILTLKGLPFAYLAIASALRGLGEEFEAAARVHGAGPWGATRIVAQLLAPAFWSAFVIVFAESVSDFGVAATLANDSHFPVATYTLYNAVYNFPVNFSVAAAVGWILMAMAGGALIAQSWALRGRSYTVLGGRTRPARRTRLGLASRSGVTFGLFLVVLVGLGVPSFGAISASLISGLGSLADNHSLTLDNYVRVIKSPALHAPLIYSMELATVTATATVLIGVVAARLMAGRGKKLSGRVLDLLLLTAVALPGIVFAAGYIFTYNLPFWNSLGIHLYGTTTLLLLGYLATALPSTSRVLLGTVGQIQESLREAGRVHGSGPVGAWLKTVLPLLARPIVAAWVLTFAGSLLELPVSQLLYPAGSPPVSVGITKALANYDFSGGTAMEVVAILVALGVMGLAWGAFRIFTPNGWRRMGAAR